MNKPLFEVADVIRGLADANDRIPGLHVTTAQQRVLKDIAECRTAKKGGHVEVCDECKYEHISYNSCRNRHCPKCQAQKRAEWLEARKQDLLPVPYFHVVFTLPGELSLLALQNPTEIYNLLFSASSDTLKEIAENQKYLGAKIGFISVLHTWGQTLVHHPHVHCIVPGGGLSFDGQCWIPSRPDYFLPVLVLSALFRGKFMAGLKTKWKEGLLQFHTQDGSLYTAKPFEVFCDNLYKQNWVVYAKPPFGGPEQVLKYLARYTHRVAISNHRIVKMDSNNNVTFTYKDYTHGNCIRQMELSGLEFLRRFVQHVLPGGFVRIHHYGFLSNRNKHKDLALCRKLLGDSSCNQISESIETTTDGATDPKEHHRCPVCGKGTMRRVISFDRQIGWTYIYTTESLKRDTS